VKLIYLLIYLISFSAFAQDPNSAPGERFEINQNHYKKLKDVDNATVYNVNGQEQVLIPFNFDNSRNKTYRDRQGNSYRGMAFLIVPDQDYNFDMSTMIGLAGAPENHVSVYGQEAVVLKSSELRLTDGRGQLLYPGIVGRGVEEISINGQTVKLVKKSEYEHFLSTQTGIGGLPKNYVIINGEVVLVLPLDDNKYEEILAAAPLNENSESNNQVNRTGRTSTPSRDSAETGRNLRPSRPSQGTGRSSTPTENNRTGRTRNR